MEEQEQQKTEINPIEEAKKVLDELRNENLKRQELLNKEQDLIARRILGGGTEISNPQKKEETNHEYRLRIERELREGKKQFD